MSLQNIINKIKPNNDNPSTPVPWYFGRKFWGTLTGLPFLLSFLFYWKNTYDPFWEKLINYFIIMAQGFNLILLTILNLWHTTKNLLYYIILYYIILGLFFYLSFKNKKVNIIFSVLIIIIIIISTYGLIGVMIGSAA